MSGTYPVSMGDRGRLEVPIELREQLGLTAGSPMLLVETEAGFMVTTRDRALDLVWRRVHAEDLVDELVGERSSVAAHGD